MGAGWLPRPECRSIRHRRRKSRERFRGGIEIIEVRRQREDWQRDATRHLATERTGEAIRAYDEHGHVQSAATRDDARAALINAAYVALSRHRDRVDLHYGWDDFADQDKLIRTLARERGKDMATDYAIEPPIAQPARDPFAGLKLKPPTVVESAPDPLDQAVVRVARATADIMRMRRQGLEELPHQQKALEESATALKGIRPDAARDLRAAFVKDMGLIDEAALGRPSR